MKWMLKIVNKNKPKETNYWKKKHSKLLFWVQKTNMLNIKYNLKRIKGIFQQVIKKTNQQLTKFLKKNFENFLSWQQIFKTQR